ncbi:MAG: PD-(D/E)XK nuclease family protein [Wenzhouxiangellaceae bacterium]
MFDRIHPITWPELCAALSGGATVLTANKRLARRLLEDYAGWQRDQGRSVWPRADILPWNAWCQRQIEAPLAATVPHLLGDAQSERLWREVISARPAADFHPTADSNATAGQCARPAAEAWALLQSHALDERVLLDQPDPEAQALAAWITAYRAELNQRNALDRAMAPLWLAQALDAAERDAPDTLVLAGFHELSPALEQLLRSLRDRGCQLHRLPLPEQPARVEIVSAADVEAETAAAAHWARARLQANPTARIAIIALDLNQRRAILERHFSHTLNPTSAAQSTPPDERPYTITLGWPLATEPIIHDALLALRWLAQPLDFERLSSLLRSPFLLTDDGRRAALELRLRQLNLSRVSLDQVLFQIGGDFATAWRNPEFASRWRETRNQLRQAPARAGTLAWASLLAQLLGQLGWGQGRTPSSREHQAQQAFQQTLEQLAGLQSVLPPCGYPQALDELEQLCMRQIFQPQHALTPILITEPLQALGLEFDHLWLLGASDAQWPEAPRPNPLIPQAIQRQHGIAHATASGELRYARTLTRQLLASATEVICSWPRQQGDRNLRSSPLLPVTDESISDAQQWLQAEGIADVVLESPPAALEAYTDDQTRAIDPAAANGSGGSGVISEQSACPFRALVRHRWRCAEPAAPGGGLNAGQRGSLLHRALQQLYQNSDGRLPAPEQWQAQCQLAVNQTFEALRPRLPQLSDHRLLASERQRLENALGEWLAVDARRPQAFQVEQTEFAQQLTLGPLQLELRVDRVDRLDSGELLLIDYKSGQRNSPAWFGERPEEPQLPLYALASETAPGGLLFGNFKPGKRGYSGLAASRDWVDGVRAVDHPRSGSPVSTWDELPDYWRQTLTPLAQAYCSGRAGVDPRDGRVCRYCRLQPLCRIHSLQPSTDYAADDAEAES